MQKYKVKQYSLNGEYIKTWNSTTEAEMYYSKSSRNHGKIGQVCNRKRKIAYGYIWRKEDEHVSKEEIIKLFKKKDYTDEEITSLLQQKINNNKSLPDSFWKLNLYHKVIIAASLVNEDKRKFSKLFNHYFIKLSKEEKEYINSTFFINTKRTVCKNKGISKPSLKQWPSKEEIGLIVSQYESINSFRYSSKENGRLYKYAFIKNDWSNDFKLKGHNLTIGEEKNNESYAKRMQKLDEHFMKVCPDDAPFIIKPHMIGHTQGYEIINRYDENAIGLYNKLIKRNYISAIPSPKRRCAELKTKFENMHETDEDITVTYKNTRRMFVYSIYVDDVCYHKDLPYNALNKRTTLFKYDSKGNVFRPAGYWTEERILEAMKSCKSSNPKSEFFNDFPGAVRPAYRLHMFERYGHIWDENTKDENEVYKKRQVWVVYLYMSNKDRSAYVGLTRNVITRRDYTHRHKHNGKYDGVYLHYNGNIPKIQILVTGIQTKEDAQYYEHFFKLVFKHMGYFIINKAATGVGTGSTGPDYPKISDNELISQIPNNVKSLMELKIVDRKLANKISQRGLVDKAKLARFDYNRFHAFTVDGEYVGEYFNFERCAKKLLGNKHLGRNIKTICDGGGDVNAMTLKGYTFSYNRNGYVSPNERKRTQRGCRGIRVAKIKDGIILDIKDNAEAYRAEGFDPHTIRSVCRDDKHSHKTFVWRYVDENDSIIPPKSKERQ